MHFFITRPADYDEWMNEWMMHLYSALLCIAIHPKRLQSCGWSLLNHHLYYHSARGYNRHPRITTAHSAQISTALLGCKVAKLREFVCVDCVRRMLFIQDLQPDNLGIYWLDYSYNEVWAIQITGVLPEVNVGSKHIKYAQWDFFFIARLKIQENI